LKAVDNITQEVKWEREVRGSEKNVLWLGVKAEYENVISQALTEALNNAAKEFSSDEFYRITKQQQGVGSINN